jgi:signal peptidase I
MIGRVWPVVFECVAPGAGLYALGHRQRALAAVVVAVTCWAGAVLATLAGSLAIFWLFIVLTLVIRVASVVLCVRSRHRDPPPLLRAGALTIALFLAFGLLAHLTKSELIQSFQLPSDSMYPALSAGDCVMVSKTTRTIERGSLVVIAPRHPGEIWIKRIVGLPGETVRIDNERVLIDGKPLPHRPLGKRCRNIADCDLVEEDAGNRRYPIAIQRDLAFSGSTDAVYIPPGHLFVLGDNRHNTLDSRILGPIPVTSIVGHVQFVWLSTVPDR